VVHVRMLEYDPMMEPANNRLTYVHALRFVSSLAFQITGVPNTIHDEAAMAPASASRSLPKTPIRNRRFIGKLG